MTLFNKKCPFHGRRNDKSHRLDIQLDGISVGRFSSPLIMEDGNVYQRRLADRAKELLRR